MRSVSRRRLLAAVACSIGIASLEKESLAQVHVTAGQLVTLAGEQPSLRGLLGDLAFRAGFELRAFDAIDRPITVEIEGLSLATTLPRLLRSESFVVGMDRASSGQPRVAWLSVLGTYEQAHQRRERGRAASVEQALSLPPAMFRAAFAGRDAEQRGEALDAIERRLMLDPARMEAFLRTEPAALAEVLARLPDAPAYLAAARERQTDARVREKIDSLLAALRSRPAAARKSSAHLAHAGTATP